MKMKNKGKVHPSPSSSSSSSSSPAPSSSSSDGDFLDVLNYLPAAILVLVSVLAMEDREVLAFMMRRSMETSSPSSESEKKAAKKASKKAGGGRGGSSSAHAPPAFNCSCFDCYMSYWVRWNSSPHGELIHQAIEAFEDQLANGEKPGKNGGKGRRREKIGRRSSEKPVSVSLPELPPPLIDEGSLVPILPSNDAALAKSLNAETADGSEVKEPEKAAVDGRGDPPKAQDEVEAAVIVPSATASNHKGLARKVWPDVLGLFNSRLWSLWGPN